MSKKTKNQDAVFLRTDDPSYIQIKELADKHNVTMEEIFSNPNFDDEVVQVLYQNLDKARRMFTIKSVFKKEYAMKREIFLNYFVSIEKR